MQTVTKSISRRQFLRGDFREKTGSIRPPWSLQENDFKQSCSRCNECSDKCPEKIIVKDNEGYPSINFDLSGCTFCQECVVACDDGALSIQNAEQHPWSITANISNKCISMQGVTCRSCADSCEEEAISFRLQVGGISQPKIDSDSCTGCGFCVVTCPVQAVKVSKNKAHEEYNYEHN